MARGRQYLFQCVQIASRSECESNLSEQKGNRKRPRTMTLNNLSATSFNSCFLRHTGRRMQKAHSELQNNETSPTLFLFSAVSSRLFSCDAETAFLKLLNQILWFRMPLTPFSGDVFRPTVVVKREGFFSTSMQLYHYTVTSIVVLS